MMGRIYEGDYIRRLDLDERDVDHCYSCHEDAALGYGACELDGVGRYAYPHLEPDEWVEVCCTVARIADARRTGGTSMKGER